MGSAASSTQTGSIAVPENPRVTYALQIAKHDNQPQLIDTPVLRDLPYGTIRYRYVEATKEPDDVTPTPSTNAKGSSADTKSFSLQKGFFYHTKLQNLDEATPPTDFRLRYVLSNPKSDKQKGYHFFITGNKFSDE